MRKYNQVKVMYYYRKVGIDMTGILGGIFDFDNDGEMDAIESAAECMFLDEEERREALEEAGYDSDDYDGDEW